MPAPSLGCFLRVNDLRGNLLKVMWHPPPTHTHQRHYQHSLSVLCNPPWTGEDGGCRGVYYRAMTLKCDILCLPEHDMYCALCNCIKYMVNRQGGGAAINLREAPSEGNRAEPRARREVLVFFFVLNNGLVFKALSARGKGTWKAGKSGLSVK